jgi:hypothetical protein
VKINIARVLAAAALIAAILAGAAWYQRTAELSQLRMSELKLIAALLKEDQELLGTLQTDAALAKDSGILTSYLAKIRADGLPKHADMKQRLDRLAENNSAIGALIDVYAPHAKTAAFRAELTKFEHHAIAWRDRWNSVMELFMAGGNYAVAEVPFPKEFASAVQAEMEAEQHGF